MVAVANYVTIDSEEVARLGLLNTLVEEEELTAARDRREAVITATVSDAVLFNELDHLLDAVKEEEAPQPIQEAQEQAPKAEEVSAVPAAVEGSKTGRRGR